MTPSTSSWIRTGKCPQLSLKALTDGTTATITRPMRWQRTIHHPSVLLSWCPTIRLVPDRKFQGNGCSCEVVGQWKMPNKFSNILIKLEGVMISAMPNVISPEGYPVVLPENRGNDGTFNVYLGSFEKMQRIAQLDYSLGKAYEQLATLLPEVTGSPLEAFFNCDPINVTAVSDLVIEASYLLMNLN